ncbi:MAG: SMI1/KNR4 family protein [Peptococcaceae bacterium]|nr:SMI1/KNR4 family protein [Peptococcaceae bacterium]
MYDIKKWDISIRNLYEVYSKLTRDVCFQRSDCTATEEEILLIEKSLCIEIPPSFKECLMTYTKSLVFSASLPDDFALPQELSQIFSAGFSWSLDILMESEESRKGWVEACFSDPDDKYDKVWHNKLAFMSVSNGDHIAFDLNDSNRDKRVVYLSHDDGEGHGYVLGDNFGDYIEKLIAIGAPGNEDWQVLPFIQNSTSGIDPCCENAKKYRQLIGIHDGV